MLHFLGRDAHRLLAVDAAKFSFILTLLTFAPLHALEIITIGGPGAEKPADDKTKNDKTKATGPQHNVTLPEEPGVNDLFNRAKKARLRAEKDPEAWPDCVKCYADILKKYPNSVYLDKWEGPEKTEPAFTNGLYRSTRERVAAELATLPPAALAVYRVINDPAARVMFLESQQQLDERKMEQAARDFFLTTWGDNALAWLAEAAADRASPREAIARYKQSAERPGSLASPIGILARTLLTHLKLGEKSDAEKTLEALTLAITDPKNGTLRVGRDEGPAALDALKLRVNALVANNVSGAENPKVNKDDDGSKWETYFGNAAHNKTAQSRPGAGLRTWSLRIDDLLYGKGVVAKEQTPAPSQQGDLNINDPSMNQQLTIVNGNIHINDSQVYAAYPASDPRPGALSAQGNAIYQLPAEGLKNPPNRKAANAAARQNNNFQQAAPIVQHPYFATLANGRAYGVLGVEAPAADANSRMNGIRFFRGGRGVVGEEEARGPSNYLVSIGRPEAGGEHKILWSIKPGEAAFNQQSKPDQDWLKGAYFVSSPTYEGGVLYCMAVTINNTSIDAFGTAFDANSGRLLWRTQICSGQPLMFSRRVQPDRGLPVAVSNRVVYLVTNLGAVAALDAGSGAVKWIRVYDRVKTINQNNFGMGDVAAGRDFWAPNPPIVHGNRLIVTPQDSPNIYAYDLESGARAWELSRYKTEPVKQDDRGLFRHMLGIVNGVLVLSGEELSFITVKSGLYAAESVFPDSPIRGRGAINGDQVFVSTDTGLLTIKIQSTDKAPFKPAKPVMHPWSTPQEEAGTVYAADGVLYTVSHTHVNAYIDWQELESKLKVQIAARPDDIEALIKLANVYKSIERFDASLAQVDAALAAAAKLPAGPKATEKIIELTARRFDAMLLLGTSLAAANKSADALARFKEAAQIAATPGLLPILSVMALKEQAELLEGTNDLSAAALVYQELLDKHADVVYQFEPLSALKAGLFARTRLNAIVLKDPKAYEAIDTGAKSALADAGADAKKLDAVIRRYPNSVHAGSALLALARIELEKTPDRSRLSALRLLNHRTADARATAAALAILATSSERINLTSAARDALLKLANGEDFKDVKISLDGKSPEISVAEWARKRLEEALFKRALGNSVFSMGAGKLKPVWNRPAIDNAVVLPLVPEGVPPVEMRRAVLSIEGGTEILALAGSDGSVIWKTRPTAPAGSNGRSFWHERLLIVAGEKAVIAYDSADNGAVAWKLELNIDTSVSVIDWCQLAGGRIIVAHSAGALEAYDASSGGVLWRTQLAPGSLVHPPAFGENFAVFSNAQTKLLKVYDLDTGMVRWKADAVGTLSVGPLVHEDRVFAAQRTTNKLCVFDARTGKRICEDISIGGEATALAASGETVFVRIARKEIAAFRVDPKNPGKEWMVAGTADHNAGLFNITEFLVDGDELLVSGVLANTKAELASYSIRRQGTLNWKRDIAVAKPVPTPQQAANMNGQVIINGAGGQRMIVQNGRLIPDPGTAIAAAKMIEVPANWLRENAARDHLLVLHSVWDVGGTARVAALVDRVTGRAVWDTDLKSEIAYNPIRTTVQLFEGGVVLLEARGRTAFATSAAAGVEDEQKDLAERAAKNPEDFETQAKLAAAEYERGAKEKALDTIAALLANPKLDKLQFAAVYSQFRNLRADFATTQHATLTFQRVEKAPDLQDNSAVWDGLKAQSFGGWRNLYLASEDSASRVQPKNDGWRGADDLRAEFKGAYDSSNLYIQITAVDDRHANAQTDAARIDFGDALTLAFDIGLSSGDGYRGEAFELAFGLDKAGKVAGVRRVEHGKYLRGASPLEMISVTRKEDTKQTFYQIRIPLEYLALKPDSDKPFGFTFALRDQDAGNDVEKSVSPSPGLVGTRKPRLFSRGILELKK